MKHLRRIDEKKPKGAPDWHDSDAPDANGRFRDLSIKDLAAWLIKTRKKDVKRISGSLTQQIVFNRNDDPKYAEKMEKVRKEVYKQLGREDLLDKMDESLVTEASKDRMIKQIKRALKDGLSIFKLPMATQTYYRKNKGDFETIEEGNYKMEDIYDLIAHHRFDKDFRKLSSKDKEWVENDAKERGFNESLLESDMHNMYYSLIDELYEAKPGPDAYMTGLSDEEKKEKEAKMKKQAEMDDDDPDSYEELPGDKEAREKGKVKKSKHTTAYNKKFKSESMKNLKSFDNFVTEKKSDLWSPFQKADILAGDMFGAMGLYRLEDDELDQIIDLKKADKLAKKHYGEFGFKTLPARDMEELLDNNPKLLRESVNEAKGGQIFPGDYVKTQYGDIYLRVDGKVGGSDAYVRVTKGKAGKRKTGLHDSMKLTLVNKDGLEESVNEAEKYVTDEFKVGDKIKTNFGEWEVIETDYAPGKSFVAPFIFKGKDMKRVNIPNPPRTNKNAVGYKVTDGDKYPIIGFLYQYKDITKLATVGVDESVVNEEKIKYAKGKTYQSSGHWTVMVDSNSSMCDIRVNHSAGWRLDPHDDREETWELLDGGRQRATLYFRSGNIDKFAKQMFDLNDETTWGNKTKLTAKDYADIIRLWIDMKKANESIEEAKLSTVHRAAKKGSYPAVIVVVQDGKVIHQEPVSTPEVAPATFNVMQKEYPKALLHLEDKTGKRLFSESVVTERLARGLKPLLKLGLTITKKDGEDALLDLSDKFDNIDDEQAEDVASHLNMAIELMQDGYSGNATKKLKQFNKACKDLLAGKEIGSSFESVVTERFDEYSFKFGKKSQYNVDDVNLSYGFWGTLELNMDEEQVSISWEDAFDSLVSIYKFTDEAALYYLNSKAGRHLADKFAGGEFYNLEDTMEDYANKGQWKKWAKEYAKFAEEDNMEEGLMIRESKSDMDEYYRELLEAEQTTNDQSPLGDDGMETGIKNKAKESGVPVGLLRIIMRRGLAAWKTGHRPGATQAQWGYARVNSFLTKQPGTWGKADSDIAKKVREGGHDKNL